MSKTIWFVAVKNGNNVDVEFYESYRCIELLAEKWPQFYGDGLDSADSLDVSGNITGILIGVESQVEARVKAE